MRVDENFVRVPASILKNKELSASEKILLIYGLSKSEDFVFGVKMIAKELRLNRKTVSKRLDGLEKKGWFKTTYLDAGGCARQRNGIFTAHKNDFALD